MFLFEHANIRKLSSYVKKSFAFDSPIFLSKVRGGWTRELQLVIKFNQPVYNFIKIPGAREATRAKVSYELAGRLLGNDVDAKIQLQRDVDTLDYTLLPNHPPDRKGQLYLLKNDRKNNVFQVYSNLKPLSLAFILIRWKLIRNWFSSLWSDV